MNAKHLLTTWTGPDNSRLMRNQTSMRLSVHVAAKISALCEMFPQRSKTQIVNDLLSTALDELEESLENTTPYWGPNKEGKDGPTQKTDYDELVAKHLEEIELSDGGAAVEPRPGGRKRATK
jgi:hypothetical protein